MPSYMTPLHFGFVKTASVRFPDELHRELTEEAKQEQRSFSQQVVWIIRRARATEPTMYRSSPTLDTSARD